MGVRQRVGLTLSTIAGEDPNNVDVRFLESKEMPGMFCAQAFQKPFKLQTAIGGGNIPCYAGIQYSGWHTSKAGATTDLELKLKLQGFRKV